MDPSLLVAVTHGLRGSTAERHEVFGPAFRSLLARCQDHRLVGLLAGAVDDGAIEVTPEDRAEIERAHQAWLGHSLRVERLLLDAVDVLDAAGIAHRVLKGVALAHTAYPNPAWRAFGDVDLLVPEDSLSRAARELAAALDGRRPEPELRPGFDDRFGKEAMLRVRGLELDLHRTFVAGALGLTIDLSDLFAPGQPFEVGGRTLLALPPPQQLLHAAYNAVMGDWPPRLIAQRDVAQILLALRPDRAEVLDLARRWRAETVLARGLTATWDPPAPEETPDLVRWARSYRPGRVERFLLASHIGPNRGYTRHVAALAVVPGVADRAAYLRAIAWPQRAYLESRGRDSRAAYLRGALRRLRR